MIEITIKYNNISNRTDVELKDVFDYCKNRMNEFLHSDIESMHIYLHYCKRDLLISYFRSAFKPQRYSFYYNGIHYSYNKRLQGLKDAVTMFLYYVEKDARLKRT